MSNETNPAAPAAPTAPPPAAPPASVPPKPAPAPPPPPDPKVVALREELQPLLGPVAVWEMTGKLPAFRVSPSNLREACQKLKQAGFDYCLLVTAADYPAQNRFEMVYALTNHSDGREVALVADVNRAEPLIDTVSDIWLTAEWHEREVFDMFGIRFNGHQDLRRILLDDSWDGHPLRKDYVDKGHEMIKRPY